MICNWHGNTAEIHNFTVDIQDTIMMSLIVILMDQLYSQYTTNSITQPV